MFTVKLLIINICVACLYHQYLTINELYIINELYNYIITLFDNYFSN